MTKKEIETYPDVVEFVFPDGTNRDADQWNRVERIWKSVCRQKGTDPTVREVPCYALDVRPGRPYFHRADESFLRRHPELR